MKPLQTKERIIVIFLVLLAWALRWGALMEVPPGWRDDDLIEVYTFSNEILTNGIKLYYAEASGQGPFYHMIRAPVLAYGGINQASVRWLSASCGTIAVLLTWAIGRRLFSKRVGLLAGALSAVSFWSLMYSRVAIRHIGALPWMLLAIYWGWRLLREERHNTLAMIGVASGTAAAMLTYYAGRLIPPLLIGALFIISSNKKQRRLFIVALTIGLALTAPSFITAFNTPGADARVGELAEPIRAMLSGDLKPILQNAWLTLGMYHAQGDPEWLYNIPHRPIFGYVSVTVFYISIINQLVRLRQDNARLTLIWLMAGISPALISQPPSSLGHTILAQPITYILLASGITIWSKRWHKAVLPFSVLVLGFVARRDLVDYFVKWPQQSMVQFLYRADYRQVTRDLDEHPDISDAAVGTMLFGQWDKVAVETDIHRQDTALRWINPDRALISNASGQLVHYIQDESKPVSLIQEILDAAQIVDAPNGLQGYLVTLPEPGESAITFDSDGRDLSNLVFNRSLVLEAIEQHRLNNRELWITTWWHIVDTPPLPPEKLYPPPPDVYGGPRLRVFMHLLKDGHYDTGDDGLWVDPYSLRTDDHLFQVHFFEVSETPYQELSLGIGLYDPQTGERWKTADGSDQIIIHLGEF